MAAARALPAALTRTELTAAALLFVAIGVTTIGSFAFLFWAGVRYGVGSGVAGLTFGGLGAISYIYGLRHGVDADHIAAIDNTTRKLLQEEKRPLTVGTWFALGHSTIVLGMIVALVLAEQWVTRAIPILRSGGAIVGTLVSGVFLFIIAVVNLVITVEVYRIFRGLRSGRFRAEELEHQLLRRGFMNRYFGRLFRLVDRPRDIYPIGVLFGLGFDTATEVAIIAIALTVAANVPLYVTLVFPLLFLCGMVLVDTMDGLTMRYAYGWAFQRPVRKVYYNLTVTVISVLVAFAVGGIEVLQVLALEFGLGGPFWTGVIRLDFEDLGFAIVALFGLTWLVALAYYRYRRLDETEVAPSETTEVIASAP
jgi:nickel/cobalt transporter (NiCoT) family protein